jgi:hypothetical protein
MLKSLSNTFASKFLAKPSFRDLAIFFLLAAIGLWAGFSATEDSAFRSPAQVFIQFLNGPDRLTFPIAVALIAGTALSWELSDRFFISTRSREDARKRLTKILLFALFRVFAIYVGLIVVYSIAAFIFVPLVHPDAISPETYGLTGKSIVYLEDVDGAPLTNFLFHNIAVFIAVSALWIGFHAITFALVTFVATLTIHKPAVALAIPMIVYVGESAVFQIAGLPASSFLISAIHPAGLQHYDLTSSIAPSLALFIVAFAASAILIIRSRTNTRLS